MCDMAFIIQSCNIRNREVFTCSFSFPVPVFLTLPVSLVSDQTVVFSVMTASKIPGIHDFELPWFFAANDNGSEVGESCA
jgi:hypothetical protein